MRVNGCCAHACTNTHTNTHILTLWPMNDWLDSWQIKSDRKPGCQLTPDCVRVHVQSQVSSVGRHVLHWSQIFTLQITTKQLRAAQTQTSDASSRSAVMDESDQGMAEESSGGGGVRCAWLVGAVHLPFTYYKNLSVLLEELDRSWC